MPLGAPVNLGPAVNTAGDEARPFVTADGQELWFDGPSRQGHPGPAVFRSPRRPDGTGGEPEEIVSPFAADLSRMLEADIYVTSRLEP